MTTKVRDVLGKIWKRAGCSYAYCAFRDPMGPVGGVIARCDCMQNDEVLVGLVELARLLKTEDEHKA